MQSLFRAGVKVIAHTHSVDAIAASLASTETERVSGIHLDGIDSPLKICDENFFTTGTAIADLGAPGSRLIKGHGLMVWGYNWQDTVKRYDYIQIRIDFILIFTDV